MIDWLSLFNNAMWVAGMAIVVATVSYAWYEALLRRVPLRRVLAEARFEWIYSSGLALFSLGQFLLVDLPGWQALLWLVLALVFTAQAWWAHYRARGHDDDFRAAWQKWWASERPLVVGIWLLGIVLASMYVLVVRPWMQPDEPRHFEVVMHVARLGKPVVYNPDLVLDWEHEIIQAMENNAFWWYGYSLVGWDPQQLPDSFVEIWGLLYSRAFFQLPLYYIIAGDLLHSWGQNFPLTAALMRLRFLSVLLFGLSLWGVYRTAREFFPQWPKLAISALAMAALWPSHLAAHAAVNNDPLVETLVIWSVFWAIRLLRSGPQPRTLLWFFTLILLTLVTKRSGFSVLVLLLAIPLWAAGKVRHDRSWRHLLALLIASLLSVALITAAFLMIKGTVRNWIPQSFLSSIASGAIWQKIAAAPLGDSLQGLLRTFIGWFGWMRVPLPEPFYLIGAILTVAALIFVVIGFAQIFSRRLQGWQRQALFLLLLLFLAQFALTFGKDIVYELYKDGSLPQARYIYPALMAFILPLLLGIRVTLGGRGRHWALPTFIILLLFFNIYVLVFLLYPFYWL
ncbi:MAG: DUF2142 domain-containing protein [Chloroflexi bacterium]|nr:DUF2142 domain-containing protein [Chloroflexota bacterium]